MNEYEIQQSFNILANFSNVLDREGLRLFKPTGYQLGVSRSMLSKIHWSVRVLNVLRKINLKHD